MTNTTTAPVHLDERDGVLVITMNRPEARNAVNAALAHAVADALTNSNHATTCEWAS